ncbi:MAG TPA: dienelactone hydrolase family protein [Paracoccaceae bacterium]|nr:dienelactone hydrolase family protein [Paracoccaceae bacterium]
MTETLTGPIHPAKTERDALVILLHGFGADGADLIGLAPVLEDHLPGVEFRAPNAPEPCSINPMGRQWFPIPRMDGSTEEMRAESMARSVGMLDAYLDEVAEETGLAPSRIALVGFSQGTMMALQVGLRRETAPAAIVGFSGLLLTPERLPDEIRVRPPVLLVHGEMDEMVPFDEMAKAAEALAEAGVEVRTHASPRTGHSIAPDGLGMALAQLKAALDRP